MRVGFMGPHKFPEKAGSVERGCTLNGCILESVKELMGDRRRGRLRESGRRRSGVRP